ncbi:unnamed protein product [Protopolystoma xenopodis]|uniref:Uncharacterized protein n=1 Tax=Protopolystoma xenopodis TaxID=117903 RepID=A0A3S5ACD5_9PLAT|nr:unnamed protein product [Protopolystoma xenopodis]
MYGHFLPVTVFSSLLSEASDISGTHQSIAAWSTFVYHLCPTTSGLVDSVTSSSSTRGLVPADSAVSLSTSALAVIQGSGAHRRTQEVLLLARLVWSSREGLPRILRLHPRLPAHEGIHDGREREEKPAIIDDVFFRGIASLASLPLRLVVPSPYFTAGSSTRQINLQEAEEADAFNCLLPPFNSLVFLHNARLVVESIPTFPRITVMDEPENHYTFSQIEAFTIFRGAPVKRPRLPGAPRRTV